MKKIGKILVANRGEIAVRIIRTCRDMGIETAAVYSEADRTALHVMMADEAYFIGPSPAVESYLSIPKIIGAAKKSRANAVHPGYGFLSEKPEFSEAVSSNGFVFLGPGPIAIEKMGNKISARKLAVKAGVPVVPGTQKAVGDLSEAKKTAGEAGYPVLLKAVSGGGGKGMRLVEKESELANAFQRAASEAKKAFGDDRLYIEKFFSKARHIEVQIVCDGHGNGVHLFERECSVQRRHQKIIEEAPSCFISRATRGKMTKAALHLALASGYSGVGTVEFLVDGNENFYFLEMNTRLQVEHPVTELITGLDLVGLQIEIGEGKKLPFAQSDVSMRGSAVECRIYAEDPENNFFPSPGTVKWMVIPEGPGIRHDTGVYEGAEVSVHYDPIISKLVAWGADRKQAVSRMSRALREYEIGGLKTNTGFLKTVIDCPEFRKNLIYTRFIDDNQRLLKRRKADLPLEILFGLAVLDRQESVKPRLTVFSGGEADSSWRRQGLASQINERQKIFHAQKIHSRLR